MSKNRSRQALEFSRKTVYNKFDCKRQKKGDTMDLLIIGMIIAIIVVIVMIVIVANSSGSPSLFEPGNRRAGRYGEMAAADRIKSILCEDDRLFTNVEISFEDRPAELNNVIVNRFGVFIIEVKNYKGRLCGNEEDYEWTKYKDDGYGNIFKKSVRNPIKQVKRQVFILAKYLDNHGSRVWVEGYVLLMQDNSPVESNYVLSDMEDIDRAIHTPGRNRLTEQQVAAIARLLR